MTNYISTTIAAGLGIYVGQVINTSLFQNITATINAFMAALLQQGLLARTSTGGLPYSVTCNTSNNPQTRTALGYVQCDVSAQYQGINEQFIVNIQGGSSVVVSSNVLPQ
jgi:phage tail sheath protein FI